MTAWWRRLSRFPGGRTVFSLMMGWLAPYTGSMGARIVDLGPGYAKWSLRDRRSVRNHLDSVHAVALVNLAEVTSGTAMIAGLPPGVRGIVRSISMEYLKKGRGTLTAECRCSPPAVDRDTDYTVTAEVRDGGGDVVATAAVIWRLSPARAASG